MMDLRVTRRRGQDLSPVNGRASKWTRRMHTTTRGRIRTVALAALVAMSAGLLLPTAANAFTTVYELEGQWGAGTPDPVKSGTALTSTWRYNINDADPAPENPPHDNLTITFTAQHGVFTEIPPGVCLTSGVTPASTISADGRTLTCNLGTRDLGTAELVITGLQAQGVTNDKVTLSAKIGEPGVNEVSATLPELNMVNPFAMDMQFAGGNPTRFDLGNNLMEVNFPWALRHAPGSTAGPNTVSYDLTLSTKNGEALNPAPAACTAQNQVNSTYPYSGSGFPQAQTAPKVTTCTLTKISSTVFRLTLTGIDYSKTIRPTQDSRGVALPTDWDVVAAGLVNLQFTYTNATTIAFTASTPTYTSTAGETSVDMGDNNANAIAVTRGSWTGGWDLGRMSTPVDGNRWTDTFRTLAGQQVLSESGVRPPINNEASTGVCTVLDTKYVTFNNAAAGPLVNGQVPNPYPGVAVEYYVGNGVSNNLNPASASYNPNSFTCFEEGLTWQTTLPADLSTVKAVRVAFPKSANLTVPLASLHVYSTVKPNVTVGQDIWTWTSYWVGTFIYSPHREMTVNPANNQPGPEGTVTPNSRYPFTGGGRDVLRIVSATPSIKKSVDQAITVPGATVNFTLKYRLDAPVNSTLNNVIVQDVLPAGLTYAQGSATTTPSTVNGQTLTWNVNGVQTNTDYTIVLAATVGSGANAGQVFTNNAQISFGGVSKVSSAVVKIRDGGYTFLTKTADNQQVPHVAGVAQDGWTVRLTSMDTGAQTFTDTVDILPFNGDGRGTHFSGSYALSEPVAAVTGSKVYYTTADPTTLKDDPADPSNGAAGTVTGNTVGWSTTFVPNATAVRVIGPELAAGAFQEFKINVTTTDATFDDMYVNRAEARASRTALVMRTSSWFKIAAVNSVAIKKYVKDAEGNWHDAQNIDDYPSFHNGDVVTYRLVVTNTGDQPLTNVKITDDKVDLAGLNPLPAGLGDGAVIPELLPGPENAVAIEYQVTPTGHAADEHLINNACASPEDPDVEASCDPAGITFLPSSLGWSKMSPGEDGELLGGAEWELVLVDAAHNPVGTPIQVSDCIADAAEACTGPDRNAAAGEFLVTDLPDGLYRLTETRAPAGYQLDSTPRFVQVQGEAAIADPIINDLAEVPALPLTGGVGTLTYTVLAGAAGVGVLILVLMRRRLFGLGKPRSAL